VPLRVVSHDATPDPDVADTAPSESVLTVYDDEHVITYLRLLDAEQKPQHSLDERPIGPALSFNARRLSRQRLHNDFIDLGAVESAMINQRMREGEHDRLVFFQ